MLTGLLAQLGNFSIGVSGALCDPGIGKSAVDQENQKYLEEGCIHKIDCGLQNCVTCSAVRIDGHNANLLEGGALSRDQQTKENISTRTL